MPVLLGALTDSDSGVRYEVTNALMRIAPEVLTNGLSSIIWKSRFDGVASQELSAGIITHTFGRLRSLPEDCKQTALRTLRDWANTYAAPQLMKIPSSENALLIRTDFSDQNAWKKLQGAVGSPEEPFMFNMDTVDDRANSGATIDQVMEALPEEYPHSFIVVADAAAMSQPDYPLLVVDLMEERGRQFRAIATQIASIENNLSIANMGFAEFAEMADEKGVFRGIPEM